MTGEGPVDAGAAPAGFLGALEDEERAALARDVAARVLREGQVGAGRVLAVGEPAAGQVGGPAPGAQRGVDAAGDDELGALADLAAGVGHGVEAAGLLGDDHSGGSAQAVPDGDLAAVDGVEPGEGLVRRYVLAALAPQRLELLLAEVEAAEGVGSDHAGGVVGQLRGVGPGVVERLLGRGEREPGDAVGLRQQPAGDVVGVDESGHLPGQLRRITARVEAADRADARFAAQGGGPPGLGAQPVGGGDTDAGDDGGRGAGARDGGSGPGGGGGGGGDSGVHRSAFRFGLVRIIALWNPPKPLPTVSTASVRWLRAVSGV